MDVATAIVLAGLAPFWTAASYAAFRGLGALFSPEADSMLLEPGKEYAKEYEVNRSLVYLAYDVPDGVYLVIYKDGNPYYWASGEIGAIELRNGIRFGTVRVEVVNSSSISQKWGCTMLFV